MRVVILGLLIAFIAGCAAVSTPSITGGREPQQVTEDSETAIENSFMALMNQTSDGERSRAVAQYLDRQRDFYYIAHGMMNTFDNELNLLHQRKESGTELTAEDFQKFNQISFQMRIAREFSERNLHEMLGIYELALIHANDPQATDHRASLWIVTNVSDWLQKSARTGDRSAVISLAEHLEDVNRAQREKFAEKKMKPIRIPSFEKHYRVSKDVLSAAYEQSLKFAKERKKTLFDSFIGQKWSEFEKNRLAQAADEMMQWNDATRSPQALDELYPDSGGKGHVTGNRFPKNTWAITLDDGPHPTHTPGMFKVLTDAKMTGTFFWLTKSIKSYPKLVAQAGTLGFNRGSHSYTHANLPKLNQAGLNHEINDAADGFKEAVGADFTLFRCPYGSCGPMGSKIRQMIADRKALHIAWNVDTLDWQDKNPQSIYERAKKQMDVRGNGIVLFHDIHSQSVEALRLLTGYIQKKGYSVRALPDIIGDVREKSFSSP